MFFFLLILWTIVGTVWFSNYDVELREFNNKIKTTPKKVFHGLLVMGLAGPVIITLSLCALLYKFAIRPAWNAIEKWFHS